MAARIIRFHSGIDNSQSQSSQELTACCLGQQGLGTASITAGNVRFSITVPYARLGDDSGHWSQGTENGLAFLDVVLHQAADQTLFELNKIDRAGVGFVMALTEADARAGEQASGSLRVVAMVGKEEEEGEKDGQEKKGLSETMRRMLHISPFGGDKKGGVSTEKEVEEALSVQVGGAGGEQLTLRVPLRPMKLQQRVKLGSGI